MRSWNRLRAIAGFIPLLLFQDFSALTAILSMEPLTKWVTQWAGGIVFQETKSP